MTLDPCHARMFSTAIFETFFSCHRVVWIVVTNYCMYLYIIYIFSDSYTSIDAVILMFNCLVFLSLSVHTIHYTFSPLLHLMVSNAFPHVMASLMLFWYLLQFYFQSNKEALSDVNATGIAMLFSAGTFLYVATVHVLPELSRQSGVRTVSADGSVVIKDAQGFTKCELLLMVVGALLPLVLSLGHHH